MSVAAADCLSAAVILLFSNIFYSKSVPRPSDDPAWFCLHVGKQSLPHRVCESAVPRHQIHPMRNRRACRLRPEARARRPGGAAQELRHAGHGGQEPQRQAAESHQQEKPRGARVADLNFVFVAAVPISPLPTDCSPEFDCQCRAARCYRDAPNLCRRSHGGHG
jgi:hypothetical protein